MAYELYQIKRVERKMKIRDAKKEADERWGS